MWGSMISNFQCRMTHRANPAMDHTAPRATLPPRCRPKLRFPRELNFGVTSSPQLSFLIAYQAIEVVKDLIRFRGRSATVSIILLVSDPPAL
jgi:hypothetical protein